MNNGSNPKDDFNPTDPLGSIPVTIHPTRSGLQTQTIAANRRPTAVSIHI